MNDLIELIDLPDPAAQPLVHPLDLPQARNALRWSWLIGALTNPPVVLCIAALVWFASQSYIAPLLAGLPMIVFGPLASRHFRDDAWAFIPRSRQDRGRPLPILWELASALVFAALLAVTLLLVTIRLSQPDVPRSVRAFIVGMALVEGVLVALAFASKVVRRRGPERRAVLFTLPGVMVVVGAVTVAYALLLGPTGIGSMALVLWGGVAMVVMAAVTEAGRRTHLWA